MYGLVEGLNKLIMIKLKGYQDRSDQNELFWGLLGLTGTFFGLLDSLKAL